MLCDSVRDAQHIPVYCLNRRWAELQTQEGVPRMEPIFRTIVLLWFWGAMTSEFFDVGPKGDPGHQLRRDMADDGRAENVRFVCVIRDVRVGDERTEPEHDGKI